MNIRICSHLISVLLIFPHLSVWPTATHCPSASKGSWSRQDCGSGRATSVCLCGLFESLWLQTDSGFSEDSEMAVNQEALVEMGHEKELREQHLPTHYQDPKREAQVTQTVPLSPKFSPPEWKRVNLMYHSNLETEARTTCVRVSSPFWSLCPDWSGGWWWWELGGWADGTLSSGLLAMTPFIIASQLQGKAQCVKPSVPITPGRSSLQSHRICVSLL